MINIVNKMRVNKTLSNIFKNYNKIDKKDLIIAVSTDGVLDLVKEVRENYIPFFHHDEIKYEDSFEYEKEKLFEEANAKFIYVLYIEKEHQGCYPVFKAAVYNDMRPSYFKADNIIIYDKQKCINGKNLYINTKNLYKEVYSID